MLIGITYNSLVWDNPASLPIPAEAQEFLKNVKFEELLWNASGLPEDGAKYSVVGKQLYYQEDANGKVAVQQESFTGEFIMGSFFVNENVEEDSILLTFDVTVLKGEIVSVQVHSVTRYNTKEHKQHIETSYKETIKRVQREQSLWFRYLYTPYMLLVRGAAYVLCVILIFLKYVISKTALLLTPW